MTGAAQPNGALDRKSPEARELYRSCRQRARTLNGIAYSLLVLVGVLVMAAVAAGVYFLLDPGAIERSIDRNIQAVAPLEPPASPDINDIALCGGTGIAVGNDGALRVLADNGRAWDRVGSGTESDLARAAYSDDCRTAMAAGDDGVVLRSADAGAAWTALPTATRNRIHDIALNAAGKAAAVGRDGLVRVSQDGGNTWSDAGNVAAADLNGVAIGAAGDMVAVGADKTILHSSDGAAWTAKTVSAGRDRDDLEDVAFSRADGRTAVAVGENGLIAVSRDNGAAWSGGARWPWTNEEERRANRADYRAVAFSGDGRTVLAVGRNGSIAQSRNSGETWEAVESGTGNDLDDVALSADGGIAVAAGEDGRILVSVDGGANWCARDSRTADGLYAVALADAAGGGARAYIGGENATALRLDILPGQCEGNVDIVLWSAPVENRSAAPAPEEAESDPYAGWPIEERLTVAIYRDIMIRLFQIGIVLLLIFLIQHLVALARYDIRLAAFYHARADAILMSEDKPLPHPDPIDGFERIARALSPDNVDFGRQPKTAADEAMLRIVGSMMRGGKGNSSA